MLVIGDNQVTENIYQSDTTIVYRAKKQATQEPVILKILNANRPSPAQLDKFTLEYQLLTSFSSEHIIACHGLEKYNDTLYMSMEDFYGTPLSNNIDNHKLRIGWLLDIGIQLTRILEIIHSKKIIHKDISPANILINRATDQLKIIDFSHSQYESDSSHHILEGSLPYIAPEQTGRIDKKGDYRSDYYSLGATLYHILTGAPPFQTSDPMEMVHFHIAKDPTPAHKTDTKIPPIISDIISKLMEKSVDSRYQSGSGIRADLQQCLDQLKSSSSITPFELGQMDSKSNFLLQDKLYGRKDQVAQGTSFLTENNNKGILLVSGAKGMGKTRFVKQLGQNIIKNGGYLISGSFVQEKSATTVYGPIIRGLKNYVQLALAREEHQITPWKNDILHQMGFEARVITELVPDIEMLIGEQIVLPVLSPSETLGRFVKAIRTFLAISTQHFSPVFFLIEDMHWADIPAFRLLETISQDENIQNLFFIISCRTSQPNTRIINQIVDIGNKSVPIQRIHLDSLTPHQVEEFLTDSLNIKEKSDELASIFYQKTDGVPLYLRQMFLTLHQNNGFIAGEDNSWSCNLPTIKEYPVCSNVVVRLIQNLDDLTVENLHILQTLSCGPKNFDITAVETILQENIYSQINQLVEKDYLRIDDKVDKQNQSVSFIHPKIQEAVYLTIDDESKTQLHYKIGNALLDAINSKRITNDKVFEVADQLNTSHSAGYTSARKKEIVAINLRASSVANTIGDKNRSLRYSRQARINLPENHWEIEPDLSKMVYLEGVRAALACGIVEKVDSLCDIILDHIWEKEDLIETYTCKLQALKATSKPHIALKVGISALHLVGIHLPENPTSLGKFIAITQTKLLLSLRRMVDFLHLPEMKNTEKLATIRFLAHVTPIVYSIQPDLLPFINRETIKLTLKYGNSREATAMGYALYGFMQCTTKRGNIKKSMEFGDLALQVYKGLGNDPRAYRTPFLVSNFIYHWGHHLKDSLPLLKQIYTSCQNNNITEGLVSSANALSYRYLLVGDNLAKTSRNLAAYRRVLDETKQRVAIFRQMLYQQVCDNLMGNNDNPTLFEGTFYSERKYRHHHESENDQTTLFQMHLFKLILFYIFKNYNKALEESLSAKKYISGASGSVLIPYFYFYDSLTKLALFEKENSVSRQFYLSSVNSNQNLLLHWSEHAPMNFLHKYHLVQAEKAKVEKKYADALNHFDTAANFSREHEYLLEEALIHERTACFFSESGKEQLSRSYRREARYCYFRFGALAKVRQLDHPDDTQLPPTAAVSTPEKTITELDSASGLDMMAVIKASRTLTSEMVLEDLLKKMLQIMIENAGAQKGFLLFEENENWFVRAKGSIILLDTNVTILKENLSNYHDELSQNIVNYVARTQETVVLNNATEKGIFVHDEYILNRKPKSILCAPIIHQGIISCILYLENNLTTRAFPAKRQEILNILGTQAAISLKNSTLYSDLGSTVEQLHSEIEDHKETQRQLLHAEKLTALGRLSASIAHEFGNPLMGIKYLLEDFANRLKLQKEDKELMKLGLHECNRMKSLMKDLHQLDKPSSGEMKKFDLHRSIQNVLIFQKKLFTSKHIEIRTDFRGASLFISAVEDQITQVLINLIMNAGDAISEDEGGVITISTREADKWVIVLVHDTGGGIRQEYQEKIFEPFFSTKPEVEGTGLGLATSYGIITSHGGEITCTSTPETGTIFKVRLPI